MYLLRLPVDQSAEGFAEEGGEERVQGRISLKEAVQCVQERVVSAHFIVNDRYVTREQLTRGVGVPEGERKCVRSAVKSLEKGGKCLWLL